MIKRLFIAFLFFLLILTILELGLSFSLQQEEKLIAEKEIIYGMIGGRLFHGNDQFGTNPSIYRMDSEAPPASQSSRPRILVLGDSYVRGDGLSNSNHLWWQQLQRQLLEAGYDVDVQAVGISGASTLDEYTILSQSNVLERLNPDLIIFGYVTNDMNFGWQEGVNWEPYSTAYTNLLSDDLFAYDQANFLAKFIKQLWPKTYQLVNKTIIDKYRSQPLVLAPFGPVLNLERETAIQNFSQPWMVNGKFNRHLYWENVAVAPLANFLHQEIPNIPSFFIFCDPIVNPGSQQKIIPIYNSTPGQNSAEAYLAERRRVMEILDRHGLDYHDFTQDFLAEYFYSPQGYDYREFIALPIDAHPGPKTTQFCAREILEYLEINHLDILGEKKNIDTSQLIVNDYLPFALQVQKLDDLSHQITYPALNNEGPTFLHWPVWEPYVKLNFQFPVNDVKRILLTGKNLNQVKLWVSKYNHDQAFTNDQGQYVVWDDQAMYPLKLLDESNKSTWIFNVSEHRDLTSLQINAETSAGQAESLQITFIKD